MASKALRLGVLAIAAIQLGGCSSFLGINFARHAKPAKAEPAAAEAELALAKATLTEAGRQQLGDGRTGMAVDSYQRALGAGEPAAPALNGLGVAYARLGRFDLAQRYFAQAMAADPSDRRYADNMTRLMRSPALAMRRDADIAAKAQAQLAAAAERQPAQAAAPSPGPMQRLSRAEVRIVTAPPPAAGSKPGVKGFKPLVRVAFADKEAEAAQGFVRIQLPEPTPAATEAKPESGVKPAGAR